MDLALSETQQLLRDSVRDFATKEIPFSRVRQVERSGGDDAELWRQLQTLGFLGLPFREDWGGSGGSFTDLAILVEELSRRAALVPLVEVMAAGVTLQRHGDAGQAKRLVEGIIAGTAVPVPAVLESSDRFGDIDATVHDGRLTGHKYFVDYAESATHFLVTARQGGEPELYLVDRGQGGVSLTPLHAIGRIPQAIVHFDGVPAERVAGAEAVRFLVDLSRVLTAVQCLACAQQALDMTVEYVSMRVQFGRPIGTFQAVQHHCANMATLVEAARFLVYEAVAALEQGTATEEQLALAKACASRAATEVPMQAHQLHGGIGIMVEYDLHFFSLRGKQRALAWGSTEECLAIASKTVEEAVEWL